MRRFTSPAALGDARTIEPTQSDATPGDEAVKIYLEDVLDDFLLDKSKGEGSGTYRRNLERDVESFVEWYREEIGRDPSFDELKEGDFRRFARHLVGRDLADGTVLTYFNNLSAFVGWAEREGYLEANIGGRPPRWNRSRTTMAADRAISRPGVQRTARHSSST